MSQTPSRTHPTTGRRMRMVETPDDRVTTDPWWVWVEPVTKETIDATDAEIAAQLAA